MQEELHVLSYSECEALLRAGVVGRIAVPTPDGPHIVPLNYSVVDGAVIFRTSPDHVVGRHGCNVRVAFEVDHVDHTYERGCSVVARGPTEVVDAPEELARIRAVWEPRPRAMGHRPLFLRLRWTELTGRRLGEGWDPRRHA